jgi:hypothetical protein
MYPRGAPKLGLKLLSPLPVFLYLPRQVRKPLLGGSNVLRECRIPGRVLGGYPVGLLLALHGIAQIDEPALRGSLHGIKGLLQIGEQLVVGCSLGVGRATLSWCWRPGNACPKFVSGILVARSCFSSAYRQEFLLL